MASKITITESEVNGIVKILQDEQANIGNYKSNLETQLSNVNDAWKGSDATKYTEKMHDDYGVLLKEFNDCYQTYIDFLKGVYAEYNDHDKKYAGMSIDV